MDLSLVKERLSNSDLAAGANTDVLAQLLWLADVLRFEPGAPIFKAGTPADGRFLILIDGRCSVEGKGEMYDPSAAGKGILMGEVGLLNPRHKRTATVIAEEPCVALSWKLDKLPEAIRSLLEPVFEKTAFERISSFLP